MPGGDGTGPFGDPDWPCRRIYGRGATFRRGFGRGFGWRYAEPITLTKEEQKKILETDLEDIELEKQAIEKKLKEYA